MRTERAEAGSRAIMTEADQRDFTGIAKHPLARKWMLTRLAEAREKAAESTTEQDLSRWSMEAERVGGELRRCGVDVGAQA